MNHLKDFLDSPWKPESLNIKYLDSFLHSSPSPEFATGEILLSSLYRNVGFNKAVSEKKPPKNGRALVKNVGTRKRPNVTESPTEVNDDLWETIVKKSITSPKQPNQSKKDFLQLSPIVPDTTIYSMAARLAGNPWNPGKLIARMIGMGADDKSTALDLWVDIFDHLSVTKDHDDIWARLLQKELKSWRISELEDAWEKPDALPLKDSEVFENLRLKTPASDFVKDLQAALALKTCLTRRQWISMLESLCRVASSSHVMWLCSKNVRLSKMLEQALEHGQIFNLEKVQSELEMNECFWALGQPAGKVIAEVARNHIRSRVSINLILNEVSDSTFFKDEEINLTSLKGIVDTLNHLALNKDHFNYTDYRNNLSDILELEPKMTACKKGISKNIVEFISYVMQQRKTSEPGLDSYDQGYFLRKKGAHSNSPWVVSLGPAALLLMVHCTVTRINGPATVADLTEQLARYGLEADVQQDKNSNIHKLLRSLGLVVESPDAEGGMVIKSPFKPKV